MMTPMTSLSLLGIQATPSLHPQLQSLATSRLSTASNQLSCMENCAPWIQLYRRAADDLRKSAVNPRRLDTLPPPNSDKLCKVRAKLFRPKFPRFFICTKLSIPIPIFTALHTMQSGISHDISVRPWVVRMSNAWIVIQRKKFLPKFLHHIII